MIINGLIRARVNVRLHEGLTNVFMTHLYRSAPGYRMPTRTAVFEVLFFNCISWMVSCRDTALVKILVQSPTSFHSGFF